MLFELHVEFHEFMIRQGIEASFGLRIVKNLKCLGRATLISSSFEAYQQQDLPPNHGLCDIFEPIVKNDLIMASSIYHNCPLQFLPSCFLENFPSYGFSALAYRQQRLSFFVTEKESSIWKRISGVGL
jgi:hypothetical protein